MKTCSFINFFWLMAFVLCLVSCDEENDFISGPTASSTMISGVARTADGTPLAGVKVSVDYNESVWLGQEKNRHKAEGITDKDGKEIDVEALGYLEGYQEHKEESGAGE